MQQEEHHAHNEYANWVNEAPSLELSAERYDKIIHGLKPVKDEQIIPRPTYIR